MNSALNLIKRELETFKKTSIEIAYSKAFRDVI